MNYPLQSVVKIRETARDEALSQLAQTITALEKAVRALAELDQQVEQARQRHLDTRTRRTHSVELGFVRMCSEYLFALEAEIDMLLDAQRAAEQARQKAESDVRNQRASLAVAEKELQAVLKHKEIWQQEQRLQGSRRDEATLDELALQQWRRRDPN